MTTFTHNSPSGQSALVATNYGPILVHLSIDLDARPGCNETRVFGGYRDARAMVSPRLDPDSLGVSGERATTKDGPQVAWSALVQGF